MHVHCWPFSIKCVLSVYFFLLTATALACALTAGVVGIVAAVAVEGVVVTVSRTVYEVENLLGVDSYTHETCLEMEVRTSASASVTAKCDRCTSFNILILLYKELRKVSVHCLKTVVVTYYYIESVTVTLKLCEANLTGDCCIDCVANVGL